MRHLLVRGYLGQAVNRSGNLRWGDYRVDSTLRRSPGDTSDQGKFSLR